MIDNPKATRLTLFLAMINAAEKFASPITPMECLIVAHLTSEWVESGEVPAPEEWDQYDYAVDLDEAIDEETATKQ